MHLNAVVWVDGRDRVKIKIAWSTVHKDASAVIIWSNLSSIADKMSCNRVLGRSFKRLPLLRVIRSFDRIGDPLLELELLLDLELSIGGRWETGICNSIFFFLSCFFFLRCLSLSFFLLFPIFNPALAQGRWPFNRRLAVSADTNVA